MPINAALIVCGLTNNAGNANATAVAAFEHEGMANVANFAHMTDKDVIEMCKAIDSKWISNLGIKGKACESASLLGLRFEKHATAY